MKKIEKIDWAFVIWLSLITGGSFLAWWTYTPQGLWLMLAMTVVTGMLGITIGYHRLLTHRSFKTYEWMRYTFAFIGGLAGEGSALHWVAVHRKHHDHSDEEDDPHSPKHGLLWSHVLWMLERESPDERRALQLRYAKDLAMDEGIQFLDKTFLLWHLLLGGILYVVGYVFSGHALAASLIVWGMFLRMMIVLHITWLINSATHVWGYRNFETKDNSRNLWILALLTFGEAWHNNHHAFPTSARHGMKWWEFDLSYITIWLLEKCHLVWDVKRPKAAAG